MNITLEVSNKDPRINPECSQFEIVERKFRGHPDTMADLVAQLFIKKYIKSSWNLFPELENKFFPNCFADKISLAGATTDNNLSLPQVITPIQTVLMGKITQSIGDKKIPIFDILKDSVESVLSQVLVDKNCLQHIEYKDFSVKRAGVDHHIDFYNPKSIDQLLTIMHQETLANDTAFVVSYTPYTFTENIVRYIESITLSPDFMEKFPYIGTDIKCMAIRKSNDLDITLCIPICPSPYSIPLYDSILKDVKEYINILINKYVQEQNCGIINTSLSINTKDTKDSKYFALWGSAISKGDIGCVGRGNRPQGFISAMRPSSVEAFSGKNPNHFSGIIYQLVADEISRNIYSQKNVKNIVIIKSNNGDKLNSPSHIHIICEQMINDMYIRDITIHALNMIDKLRYQYIMDDPFERFINF